MTRMGVALAGAVAIVFAAAAPARAADKKIEQEKQQVFSTPGTDVTGTVKSYSNGVLQVQPYAPNSQPQSFTLGSGAPIFQGDGKIGPLGLQPGVDVRVRQGATGGGEHPPAVGVAVLPPSEAQQARAQASAQTPPVPGQPPTAAPPAVPVDPRLLAEKDRAVKDAAGSQPGKVVEVREGVLHYDPYQKAAGDARLKLKADTPVFQQTARANTLALQPGTDVRVYYDKDRENVVAVEILPADQAQQIRTAVEDVPRPPERKK